MNRKKALKLLADGHIDQKEFDLMFPAVVDDVDEVLMEEPDLFLAKVISECDDLAITAKRRLARSKSADARLRGVLAKQQNDHTAAKHWFNVAYELRILRA
tara:strand:+ start:78 stop:380 length:303 start_codon:yes stop_codon:yes gene_type:complete